MLSPLSSPPSSLLHAPGGRVPFAARGLGSTAVLLCSPAVSVVATPWSALEAGLGPASVFFCDVFFQLR
eukprot:4342508-Pyramimonas_sp.AAC.1